MNKILSILDLPIINSILYKKHERIIGPTVENIAKESCAEVAAMERELTIKNVDHLKKSL